MTIYLLSFILCFEADGWYRPSLFRWLMPVAWIAICSRTALEGSVGGLRWEIPIFCVALFICCMFCHGELARSKPAPQARTNVLLPDGGAGRRIGRRFRRPGRAEPVHTLSGISLGVTGSVFLALYFLYGYRSPGD